MSKLVVRISDLLSWCSSCCVRFLSAHKTNGGTVTNWVGFELLLKEHALGLTERRAAWVVEWARETAAARVIHVRAYEEALGRIVFATSALELVRPFLPPLYAFATSCPRESVRPVPAYVAFFLRFLAGAVERERQSQCAAILFQEERAPRVDAQASDERAGVGGWLPAVGPSGRPDPGHSYWFSEEITPEAFPWVFKREGRRHESSQRWRPWRCYSRYFHSSRKVRRIGERSSP